VPHENWQSEGGKRHGSTLKKIKATCDELREVEFQIQLANESRGTSWVASCTLVVKSPPWSWQAICRYDIQNNDHTNGRICGMQGVIPHRSPHRHIYCPECHEKLNKWDACAEFIDQTCISEPLLRSAFIRDLKIHTTSSAAHRDMFDEVDL
jgi:hypothetical protein